MYVCVCLCLSISIDWSVVDGDVDGDGVLDMDRLDAELAHGPVLVSIMLANNETGVITPVAEVARRAVAVQHVGRDEAAEQQALRPEEQPHRQLGVGDAERRVMGTVTVIVAPSPACLPAFCSASRQQK